jgi:hypothetical protein
MPQPRRAMRPAGLAMLVLLAAAVPAAGQEGGGPSVDEQIDLALGALDDALPPVPGGGAVPPVAFPQFQDYPRLGQPFDQQPIFAQEDFRPGAAPPRRR